MRQKHNNQQLSFKAKGTIRKFIPRKQYHEASGYKRSSSKDVELESADRAYSVLELLADDLEALELGNSECESMYNEFLPSESIIDPEGDFFSDPLSFKQVLVKAIEMYNGVKPREFARVFPEKVEEALNTVDRIPAEDFGKLLRAPLICRQSNLTVYLETVVEAVEESQLTVSQKELMVAEVLAKLSYSIEVDTLQDNILLSLTILKGMGLLDGQTEEFYVDLENIYDSMTQSYSSLYNQNDKTKMLDNPADRYREYMNRQRVAAEDVNDLMYRYFRKYLQQ